MSNLTFDERNHRVNVRCAAIIRHEGHVLVCREDDDEFVCLPGGRVQRGESSLQALHREMDEELNAKVSDPQLRYIIENFFWRYGKKYHEFGFYYEVEPPNHIPFKYGEPCATGEDDGTILSFEWASFSPEGLAYVNLHPHSMRTRLVNLPTGFLHQTVVDPDY